MAGDETWIETEEMTPGGPSEPNDFVRPEPATAEERYGAPKLLGKGGIGVVFAVHDARLGREVARKELRDGVPHHAKRRFVREARITAQLEHPGIVPVHDAGKDDEGRDFFTMKYVRGKSLADALKEAGSLDGRLEWVDAVSDAVQAMAYAHSRGVIHRDLKPENLMVGEFGETLVVDWGLARALDEEQLPADSVTDERPIDLGGSGHTVLGRISGTPAYMSPEQAQAEELSPASDVWGLGAVLYEVLTGRPPYRGTDVRQVLDRAARCAWKPVTELEPKAPAELVAIAHKAMQTDPARRYPDASAMHRDLSDWQHGRRVSAYEYSSQELLLRFLHAYRLPLGAVAAGLALTLLVGGIGLRATQLQRDEAVAAQRATELALAGAYQSRAETASAEQSSLAAQLFAASALVVREDPVSRGILMQQAGTGSMELVDTLDIQCQYGQALADGWLCAQGRNTVRLTEDGTEVWRTDAAGRITGVHENRLGLYDNQSAALRILDLASGRSVEILPTGRAAAWLSDGRMVVVKQGQPNVVRTEDRIELTTSSMAARVLERDDGFVSISVSGVATFVTDDLQHRNHDPGHGVTFDATRFEDGVVLVGEDLTFWDADLAVLRARFEIGHQVASVTVLGPWVVASDVRGRTWVWDPHQNVLLTSSENPGELTLVSAHGDLLHEASSAGIRRWRILPGQAHRFDVGSGVNHVRVGADRKRAFFCAEKSIGILTLSPIQMLWSRDAPRRPTLCGWKSASELVTLPQNPGAPAIRDPTSGSPLGTVPWADFDLNGSMLADTTLVVYGSGSVELRRLDDGTSLHRVDDVLSHVIPLGGKEVLQSADQLISLPDLKPIPGRFPRQVVAATERWFLMRDGRDIALHSRASGKRVCDLGDYRMRAEIRDDLLFVTRRDSRISVLRVPERPGADCTLLAELRGHAGFVNAIVFSGDSLLTAGADGTIRRWDLSMLDANPEGYLKELTDRTGFDIVDGQVGFVR